MKQNRLKNLAGLTICSLALSYSKLANTNEDIRNCHKVNQEQIQQLSDDYAMLLIYDSNPLSKSNEKNETSLDAFTQFSINTQLEREYNTYLFDCNEEVFCQQFVKQEFDVKHIPSLIFYCKGEQFRKFHRIPVGFVGVNQIAYGLELGYDHFLDKCEKD